MLRNTARVDQMIPEKLQSIRHEPMAVTASANSEPMWMRYEHEPMPVRYLGYTRRKEQIAITKMIPGFR
jgi:hypothetical protein